MESKRIEYIDLMKGICIIMVVLYHIQVFKNIPFIQESLQVFRMPLYFFLSGIFFKTYGSFKKLIIKKINNLLFPFLFFSLLVLLDINETNKDLLFSWKYYFFLFLEPYNIPLWFLRCLFIVYIIYYVLCKYLKDIRLRVLVCFITTILLWYINPLIKANCNELLYWILYRMNIISAFMALPFISIAEWLRIKDFFQKTFSIQTNLKLFIVCIILWIIFYSFGTAQFMTGNFTGNVICYLIASFSGLLMILFISRIFNKVFYISYMGRYSIIVLGLHAVFISLLHNLSLISQTLIILGTMPICIYFFKKYFPYFTAQKQMVYLKNNKVCFFES